MSPPIAILLQKYTYTILLWTYIVNMLLHCPSFEKAKKLEEKLQKSNKALTPLQEYKNRNEIMRIRLEGMIAAAKVKSTSEKMRIIASQRQSFPV